MKQDFSNVNIFPDILIGYKQFCSCMGGVTEKTFRKWEKKYGIPVSHAFTMPMIPRVLLIYYCLEVCLQEHPKVKKQLDVVPISPFSYNLKPKRKKPYPLALS